MKEIKVLATKFRKALEKAKDDGIFIYIDDLSNFPSGCCGTTSELLAEFLKLWYYYRIFLWRSQLW